MWNPFFYKLPAMKLTMVKLLVLKLNNALQYLTFLSRTPNYPNHLISNRIKNSFSVYPKFACALVLPI